MDDLTFAFDSLKLSAFSKLSVIKGDIHDVTIGPNSSFHSPSKKTEISQVDSDKSTDSAPTPQSKSKTKQQRSPISEALPLKQIQQELETKRQDKVEEAIQARLSRFENFFKNTQNNTEWVVQQQAFIDGVHQQEQTILKAMQSYDSAKLVRNKQLAKHYQEIAQRKIEMEKQLEQNKEKKRQMNELLEKIKKCQINFRIIYQDIASKIKTCKSNEMLRENIADDLKVLKSLSELIEALMVKCKSGKVDESDLKQGIEIVNNLKIIQDKIDKTINNINNEVLAKEEQEKLKKQQEEQKHSEVPQVVVSFEKIINVDCLKRYNDIFVFHQKHSQSFQELLNSENLKQFRFDCKKAVNIPTNSISAVNAEHLRDKYVKLSNLLSGKTVSISDRSINAGQHPQGIAFCLDLLTKKFVLQGDLMISSNPEAAFSYATVILSLWHDFPDFGKLILAQFYERCPYLIPFYPQRTEGQTDEEYFASLGYQYSNGQIEKQDKFLKRISGIFRLYFAILISKPKKPYQSPFNIKNAWTYLTNLLKLEPQLDVTATALHIFLEVAGFEMENVYGKAFAKLIRIIEIKFLPLLQKIDSGGPVTRLEVLLQNYRKEEHFKRPNGLLSNSFW